MQQVEPNILVLGSSSHGHLPSASVNSMELPDTKIHSQSYKDVSDKILGTAFFSKKFNGKVNTEEIISTFWL